MQLIETLSAIWSGIDYPFLIHKNDQLKFSDIAAQDLIDLTLIKPGDVVAIIGDFDPPSILVFLRLIDLLFASKVSRLLFLLTGRSESMSSLR